MLGGCCLRVRGGIFGGEDPFTKNDHGVIRFGIQDISDRLWWVFLDEVSFENAQETSGQNSLPKTPIHVDTIISSVLRRPINVTMVVFRPFIEVMIAKDYFVFEPTFTPEAKEN